MRVTVPKIGTGASPEDSIRPDLSAYNVQSCRRIAEDETTFDVEIILAPSEANSAISDATTLDELKTALLAKFAQTEPSEV